MILKQHNQVSTLKNKISKFDFLTRFRQEFPDYPVDASPVTSQEIEDAVKAFVQKRQFIITATTNTGEPMATWWLWWVFLNVIAVREEPEFDFLSDLISAAGCLADLEVIGLCIQIFAGHQVDDRELFLQRLRKVFTKKRQSLAGTSCATPGHCAAQQHKS